MIARGIVGLIAVGLLGCGSAQPAATAPVEESSLADLGATSADTPAPACPGDVITRADLDAVLDAGPAALLALVETRPRHRAGRFVGFEIVRFTDTEPACPALRAGDLLVSVNGKPIERPEHLFELFQLLRGASELELQIERGDGPRTLRYAIAD